ncbi:16S rRNA (cytidine(1402)-2'-O)-methyltransferase [Candidatus Pelagibacter sp.]|nr:16S rRNA (cytidine(1402)-2'-O)-methyltransferase [Candidatus Pelagibacter sp.]
MISQSQKKGLYLVSTPIGNLGDLTIRALEILKNSELILCEDTRVSIKLLNHFNIKTQLIAFHKFNERKKTKDIINHLMNGKIISLISDAGTPAISDPGKLLVQECISNDIPITPIPGTSSVITSLSISGFSDKFIFFGFLEEKKNKLIKDLEFLSKMDCSIVLFIPPKKLIKNLELVINYFKKREIVLCREMTKIHEEFIRCKVEDLKKIKIYDKGELTIVISEIKEGTNSFGFLTESDKKIIKTMLKNKSIKDIIKKFSNKKIPKKIIYDSCLKLKNEK